MWDFDIKKDHKSGGYFTMIYNPFSGKSSPKVIFGGTEEIVRAKASAQLDKWLAAHNAATAAHRKKKKPAHDPAVV